MEVVPYSSTTITPSIPSSSSPTSTSTSTSAIQKKTNKFSSSSLIPSPSLNNNVVVFRFGHFYSSSFLLLSLLFSTATGFSSLLFSAGGGTAGTGTGTITTCIHSSSNNSKSETTFQLSNKKIMTFTKQSSSSSTLLAAATRTANNNNDDDDKEKDIQRLAKEMDSSASNLQPFTSIELQELRTSFQRITEGSSSEIDEEIMWTRLNDLYANYGHLTHKDWKQTEQSSKTLTKILLNTNNDDTNSQTQILTPEFQSMFHRVLTEGNWNGALQHAKQAHVTTTTNNNNNLQDDENNKPWAVLVTGVNGIRKTTSVYQSWFTELLQQALVTPPTTTSSDGTATSASASASTSSPTLPTGKNSFFRQLDHMIATISNYNFELLYKLTSQSHNFDESTSTPPSKDIIQQYSNYKAAIFKRYRTLSEILGVTLIQAAQTHNLNVMIETSGRDVAMFHYVDMFFPAEKYNKLVLHFEINDLVHAEQSVDQRMIQEMEVGVKVLKKQQQENNENNDNSATSTSTSTAARDLINVNAGGPYGSEVLKGIQEDSDAVWQSIVKNDDNESGGGGGVSVGHDWYKASIQINASSNPNEWTANAILPNGDMGKVFTFEPPRKV